MLYGNLVWILITAIFAATLMTQASNYIAISIFKESSPYYSAFLAAFFTLPLTFMGTFFFNVFFSQGHQTMNYATLNIMAIGLAMTMGIAVQYILGSKTWSIQEIAGSMLVVGGVAVILSEGING